MSAIERFIAYRDGRKVDAVLASDHDAAMANALDAHLKCLERVTALRAENAALRAELAERE